jgi:hypothetical protein
MSKTIFYSNSGADPVVIDDRSTDQAKQERMAYLRYFCTEHLLEVGLDQITQQNAALGIYEPARCEAIKNYIAACRNEYLRCKALILAATNNDEADAVQFIAPPVPEGL